MVTGTYHTTSGRVCSVEKAKHPCKKKVEEKNEYVEPPRGQGSTEEQNTKCTQASATLRVQLDSSVKYALKKKQSKYDTYFENGNA